MRVMEYLKELKWPDTIKDFADLVSKTVIAVFVAAVGVGYNMYNHQQVKASDQQAKAEAEWQKIIANERENREDIRATYRLLLTNLPENLDSDGSRVRVQIALEFCNIESSSKEQLIAPACEHLNAYALTADESNAAIAGVLNNPSADYLNSQVSRRVNISTAASEAGIPPPKDGSWFAVVGTVPIGNEAAATKLAESIGDKLVNANIDSPVILYKTKISQSYALTLDGPMSREQAVDLARRVRASGIVMDAFPQPDRDWEKLSISN